MAVITAPQTAPGTPPACPTQTIIATTLKKYETYQSRWSHCLIQQSYNSTAPNYILPSLNSSYSTSNTTIDEPYDKLLRILLPVELIWAVLVLIGVLVILVGCSNMVDKSCARLRGHRERKRAARLRRNRHRAEGRIAPLPLPPRNRIADMRSRLTNIFPIFSRQRSREADHDPQSAVQLTPVERLSLRVRSLSKRHSSNPLPLERPQTGTSTGAPVYTSQDLQHGIALAMPDEPPEYPAQIAVDPPAYQSADDPRFAMVAAPLAVPEPAYRASMGNRAPAQWAAQPSGQTPIEAQIPAHAQPPAVNEPPPPHYSHHQDDPLYQSESDSDSDMPGDLVAAIDRALQLSEARNQDQHQDQSGSDILRAYAALEAQAEAEARDRARDLHLQVRRQQQQQQQQQQQPAVGNSAPAPDLAPASGNRTALGFARTQDAQRRLHYAAIELRDYLERQAEEQARGS